MGPLGAQLFIYSLTLRVVAVDPNIPCDVQGISVFLLVHALCFRADQEFGRSADGRTVGRDGASRRLRGAALRAAMGLAGQGSRF